MPAPLVQCPPSQVSPFLVYLSPLTLQKVLTVSRHREHLYRRHQLPKFQCIRCHERFINESGFQSHHRQPVACKAEPKAADWISQEQVNMLRNQRNRSASQEEKWRDMYKILFPEEEIAPNPCEHFQSLFLKQRC